MLHRTIRAMRRRANYYLGGQEPLPQLPRPKLKGTEERRREEARAYAEQHAAEFDRGYIAKPAVRQPKPPRVKVMTEAAYKALCRAHRRQNSADLEGT
jgi:hypothetical protein